MLNDPLSHGLWETTAPPAPPTGPLIGDVKADVVVVGCGYTGLSAALHLAEAGARVVALEAVEVGYGAAGRNVGFVNAGMWVMPSEIPKALGPDYGERALTLLDDGPAAVWALIEKHANRLRSGAQRHAEMRRRQSGPRRDRGARGAALCKRRAGQRPLRRRSGGPARDDRLFGRPLRPARRDDPAARLCAWAGAGRDRAAGAVIHTQSAVRAAERASGAWRLVTERGSATADWVIVATDAYGGAPWPQGRREQILLPYFNFATRPLSANLTAAILPGREGCWDTRTIMSYFRMDRDGRFVFGSVGALRGTGLAVHRAWAGRAIAKLFPQLGPIEFEHAWYGMIGMTADNLPRFHRLAENVVSFSGYNGRGIGTGTVFGRVLADHVLGRIAEKDLPLPVTTPDTPALPALREAYYEAGAQIAHAVGGWV